MFQIFIYLLERQNCIDVYFDLKTNNKEENKQLLALWENITRKQLIQNYERYFKGQE